MPEKTDKDMLIPENMLKLYRLGAFPMSDDDDVIRWYMPEIRTIIPLNKYNIPRSLKKFLQNSGFEYRFDYDTMRVVIECSRREETWISDELIDAYNGLHKLGCLHSVEVYQENKLVGGLYGIASQGAFFGESMFSRVPQASKAALAKLLEHLDSKGFKLLDVQYMTEHLKMFGAIEIDMDTFQVLKDNAFNVPTNF